MSQHPSLEVSAEYVLAILKGKLKSRFSSPKRRYERSDMKLPGDKNTRSSDYLMVIGSGTPSYMKPHPELVRFKSKREVSITYADDSTVHSTQCGTRKVEFMVVGALQNVILPETLIVTDASMSILSVQVLKRKDIGILFM